MYVRKTTRITSKDKAIAEFVALFGHNPVKSWTEVQIRKALCGVPANKGKASKDCLKALYVKEVGAEPCKSWTGATIAARLESKTPPRGKANASTLPGMTVVALRKMASEKGIVGRSKMNKAELVAALEINLNTQRHAA